MNMKGKGADSINDPNNKWNHINQIMRENKIGVLTLQETHTSDEQLEKIQTLFQRQLVIHNSADPGNPTGKGGVAIILNKGLTNVKGIEVKEIVPGRALLLSHPWHDNKTFTFLAIYAPAGSNREKIDFWKGLTETWEQRRLPVEETIDLIDAFRTFRQKFTVIDGWREFHPLEKGYSFVHQSNCSRSRIDRIYTNEEILRNSREWEIIDPPINTDHKLVMTTIIDPQMPIIGDGRWAIPQLVLKSKEYLRKVTELGAELEQEIEKQAKEPNTRTNAQNIQILYKDFKMECTAEARKIAKKIVLRAKVKIKELEQERKHILNNDEISNEEKILQKDMQSQFTPEQ
ncbi:DNase I-like protein [Dendrothele bispora CBS 962.96]|uniref:DNase I-like protein n=1 Tax=Dendrothele bispora (strain CBS 962.96) TaxID=1314807 RepID=A0A4V4HBH3_DENBC|nr:DNase I-like protein [Dendrothele bispora CBS 962.96]